jgi:hypothetical protein
MAERDDAGIAEDEVQRDGQQREDGDLGQDQHVRRQDEDRPDRDQPEPDLPDLPALGAGEQVTRLSGGGAVLGAHRPPSRENSPCGRRISTRIITA